jgi:hypothetical protein
MALPLHWPINATVVPNTRKTPSIMLYKMLVAPLSLFDGGGGVPVGAVGDEPDVVDGVVEPSSTGGAGVVGVLGVPLAAATVIASFMPPEQ